MTANLDREMPSREPWQAAAALGLEAYWMWVHVHFGFAGGRARRTQYWNGR